MKNNSKKSKLNEINKILEKKDILKINSIIDDIYVDENKQARRNYQNILKTKSFLY